MSDSYVQIGDSYCISKLCELVFYFSIPLCSTFFTPWVFFDFVHLWCAHALGLALFWCTLPEVTSNHQNMIVWWFLEVLNFPKTNQTNDLLLAASLWKFRRWRGCSQSDWLQDLQPGKFWSACLQIILAAMDMVVLAMMMIHLDASIHETNTDISSIFCVPDYWCAINCLILILMLWHFCSWCTAYADVIFVTSITSSACVKLSALG